MGDTQLDTPALTVPHPRMYERAFVLLPLAQLDASLVRADQLAAVADQRIAVAQDADWAASALQA